jgi:beta-lactamase regulating signal transducer with metallopeptidase domain
MNAMIESLNAWGARFAGFALPMLLQSGLLIAFLFALDLALRKRVRATIRYAVWMLALVKLALPPSLALPTGAAYWLHADMAASSSVPATALVSSHEEMPSTTIDTPASTVRVFAPPITASPVLTREAVFFVVWLAVALGIGIWVFWRLRAVVGVIRQSAEAPEALRVLLESCRRQLGIKREIQVRCAAIGSPAICGILRPIILMPPALAENLGGSEMRSVLLHELAHYKRGDLWVNQAQILLQIVYWHNPLLWLANASIRRAREQAVDEMVLVEMRGEAAAYPATLLQVAKLGLGRPSPALGLMGILEPGRGLRQRILHIMNRPLPRTARIGARGLAAVLLLALVALPMASHTGNAGAGIDQTVRIEGVVMVHRIDPEGHELPYQSFEDLYFTLWQSGSRWMYRCSVYSNVDLNLAGGAVSFDGTNLYRFDPAARGTHFLRDKPEPAQGVASINTKPGLPNFERASEPFQGIGSMEANPAWRFGGCNGPLWWAYASSFVLQTNGPAPTFLVQWDERHAFSLKREPVNEAIRRVGPINASLSVNFGRSSGDQTLAEIHPVTTNETDGIRFITKCEVITYGAQAPKPGEWTTNWTAKLVPAARYEIVLNKFGVEHSPVSFVPQIRNLVEASSGGSSVPQAVRASLKVTMANGAEGDYVGDHWFTEDELRSNGVSLIKVPKPWLVRSASLATQPPRNPVRTDERAQELRIVDMPLPDAIRMIASQAGLNVEIDPRLANPEDANHHPIASPTVYKQWTNVTPREVLQELVDQYGLQMSPTPGSPVLHIGAKDTNGPDADAKPVPPR